MEYCPHAKLVSLINFHLAHYESYLLWIRLFLTKSFVAMSPQRFRLSFIKSNMALAYSDHIWYKCCGEHFPDYSLLRNLAKLAVIRSQAASFAQTHTTFKKKCLTPDELAESKLWLLLKFNPKRAGGIHSPSNICCYISTGWHFFTLKLLDFFTSSHALDLRPFL